ncbi:Cullin binding-domain-containing protein, partial [Dichotomocladium elegans]
KGSHLEKVKRLMEFTNLSEHEAIQRLRNAQWDVNVALNAYYESENQPRADNNKNTIAIEGTMQLCEDLGIEPTQFEFLVVSYRLGSERMGEFSKSEFVKGMVQLHCNTIQDLQGQLDPLMRDLEQNADHFRAIYNYAFALGRQTGQKSLSLEAAVELWRLLLSNRFSLLEHWITFLEKNHGKAISKDTWTLFFEFAMQPKIDLDAHDSEGAWPILIDEVRRRPLKTE